MRALVAGCLCTVFLSAVAAGQTFQAVSWNVESGGANPDTIGTIMAQSRDVDIWGISEALAGWAQGFADSAAVGEGATYDVIIGTTGGADRLLIIYDSERFEVLGSEELADINIGGRVRAPLVAHFRDTESDHEFLFMVNHLYRSRPDRRHDQSRMLNAWSADQTLPVIAVGDYNYDWEVADGDADHDDGYDLLTAANVLVWVRPATLRRTQCSAEDTGCRFDSVLDFVFVAHQPAGWTSESVILTRAGDFPDDNFTSDHRRVAATFQFGVEVPVRDIREQLLQRIHALEAEVAAIRALVEKLQ